MSDFSLPVAFRLITSLVIYADDRCVLLAIVNSCFHVVIDTDEVGTQGDAPTDEHTDKVPSGNQRVGRGGFVCSGFDFVPLRKV